MFRLVAISVALAAATAAAQGQTVFGPPAERPRTSATRARAPLQIDGLLDEPDWTRAAVADGFVQAEPEQGRPAGEPTQVRLLFDDRHLYVGVTCLDSRGSRDLRVRDLRRDFDETTDDFFGIAIDGVRDSRSALVFRVNPMGALRDQQTVDGGLADLDFDAVWTARTSRTDDGWTAEIAIPWRTLRYRRGEAEWGINFHRVNRRVNESSGWSPWPRSVLPYRMDYAGLLTGLEPPPPSRNLRLVPYASGEARRSADTTTDVSGDMGLDVKWAVTPNTVVDFTANPDFGHTDVDRQVVNLTRFSVFFPERRQFFLENRGVFLTGNGQRFEPFFSRRIGLDAEGDPIPIVAGARVSTRSASGAFGAMFTSQEGQGENAPASRVGVVRHVANFGRQNRLGSLVAVRSDEGGRTNVVGGIDGFWRPTRTSFVRGTLTGSSTSGEGGEGLGGYVWGANEANWGYVGYISELVTSKYDARSGFILRNDYLRISPAVTLDWRPRWRPRGVRRFRPGFTLEHYVRPSTGNVQEGFLSLRPMTVELENGGSLQYVLQPNWQRPTSPFGPLAGVDIAPGAYDFVRHSLTLQTDPSARLAMRVEGATGGYFDGRLHTIRGVLQTTPDPRVAINADYTLNRLEDVGRGRASLATHLLAVETRLAANPRLQLVGFVQWNTSAQQLAGNARLTWEHKPLAFVTVVYYHRAPVAGLGVTSAAPPQSRQFLVKCTWPLQW